MGVFLVTDGGRVVEMTERPYELEDVLQARLSDYPQLLASEECLSLGGGRTSSFGGKRVSLPRKVRAAFGESITSSSMRKELRPWSR